MPRGSQSAPKETKAPEKQSEEPAAQTEPQKPQAQRPVQTQQSSQEGRVIEGRVPVLELFKPDPIDPDELAKLNVWQRWNRIIGEMGLIPKRGWNDHHKYWFTTDADLNAFIGPLFRKYHLVVIPTVTGVERIDLGTKQTLTRVALHITVLNADKPEDKFEVDWIGEGGDTVDKGIYKSYTGGLKYFYMKLLQVTTGDDPEAFVKTDQLAEDAARAASAAPGASGQRPVSVQRSSAPQPEKGGRQNNATEVQLRQVGAMKRALGLTNRGLAETIDRALSTNLFDTVDGMDSDDDAERTIKQWLLSRSGEDIAKLLNAMAAEVAERSKEPKPEPEPEPAPQPSDDDEPETGLGYGG